VYIDQFIETWAMEAPIFRSQKAEFENLVALWAADARDTASCAWCVAAGGLERHNVGDDSLEHARAHLERRVSATEEDA